MLNKLVCDEVCQLFTMRLLYHVYDIICCFIHATLEINKHNKHTKVKCALSGDILFGN